MALQIHQQLMVTVMLTDTPAKTSVVPNNVVQLKIKPLCLSSIRCRTMLDPERCCQRMFPMTKAVEEGKQSVESESSEPENAEQSEQQEARQAMKSRVELSELGSEIKKMLQERKEKERGGEDLLSGVAEEIREIEWPAFGKVLGTTGVVLGVIAGSSFVLLTVNAVLAELSDKVFAGKGVQDFFS